MNYLNNTVPSPNDQRDWLGESIYPVGFQLPLIVDHRYALQPIKDQGTQGTCAAQTAACMKEWQELHDVKFNQYMSPQFIYNNRKNQDSEGMFGRDVMRIMSKIGSCSEKNYPYELIESPENIKQEILEEAKLYKIKSYAQIKTIEGLKKALFINGPCYISFPVYNYSETMWKQKLGETSQGGHAMTVVGYNEDGFIIRNSWGEDWGDKGYCYYSYSDWGCHWEAWTTIDEKSYQQPILPEPKYDSDQEDSNIQDETKDIKFCCFIS